MSFQRPFLIALKRQRPGHPWGFVLAGDRDADRPLRVYKVAPDGPAEQAGLRAGDELIQVGRLNVQDMDQEQVQDIISGSADRLEMFVIREDPVHSRKVQTEQHQTVKTLVHNQYNSPIHLYSEENIDETIARHTEALTNGLAGFDLGLKKKFPETPPPSTHRSTVFQALRETEGDTTRTEYENQVTERYVSSSTLSSPGPRKQPPPPPPKPQPPAQVHSGRPSSPELKRHVSTAVYTPSPVTAPSRPQFPTSPGGQQQYYNQTPATPSSPQQYYNQTPATPSTPQQYYNQTSKNPSGQQQYYNQTTTVKKDEQYYNRQQQYYNQTPGGQQQYYTQAPASPGGQPSYYQGPPSAGIGFTSSPPAFPQARIVKKQPPDSATSTVSSVAYQWPPEHQHLGTRSPKTMPEDMSRRPQQSCTFSSNIPYSPMGSPPMGRRGNSTWPPKHSSVREVPKTGFSPTVTREHGPGKRFIWPPPDSYAQWSHEGSATPPVRNAGTPPISNAWHPTSPSPYSARSPPFARSPSLTRRCLDVVWPPPKSEEYQVRNVSSKPYKRLSRFEDHITQTASVGVPPTYRPPPGTHHVDVGY